MRSTVTVGWLLFAPKLSKISHNSATRRTKPIVGPLLGEDTSKMMSDWKVRVRKWQRESNRNLHSLLLMATDKKAMKATTANREKKTPMEKKNLRPFSQVLQRSCRYMTWAMMVQSANTPEGQRVQEITFWWSPVFFLFTPDSLLTSLFGLYCLTKENKHLVIEMYVICGDEE